jgi:hypothetical protein
MPDTDALAGRPVADVVTETGQPDPAALLMARMRAGGQVNATVPAATVSRANAAAAGIDRRLGELTAANGPAILVRGWLDGAAPNPDLHPSAPPRTLPPVANLVWAACLGAAWPDASASPYPGRQFSRQSVVTTCVALNADRNTVVTAFDTTLPAAGLIFADGDRASLGPAAAALPSATWAQLRRIHDRLPKPASLNQPEQLGGDTDAGSWTVRWFASETHEPATEFGENIRTIVCALETAEGPIRAGDLPALADPAIRAAVETTLVCCGRTLISVGSHSWITGYPSAVAARLARDGIGTLTAPQRAVLALVLLHTVAIPRSRGLQLDDTWASGYPVQLDMLIANRAVNRSAAVTALRALRRAGYVITAKAGGYQPGPALLRLTLTQRKLLWEDLIILGPEPVKSSETTF